MLVLETGAVIRPVTKELMLNLFEDMICVLISVAFKFHFTQCF